MDDLEKPSEHNEINEEERARQYEAVHNRLFVLRTLVTVIVLAVYLFSGASAQLAEGLRNRFGAWWPLVNGVYLVLTVFGFAALTFPLSLYSDFVVERQYGLSKEEFSEWFTDFLKSLGFEMLLVTAFFEVVYAFLRWAPNLWWLWASVSYVLFAIVLTSIAPVVIMPLFHKFEALADSELTTAVKEFAQKAGLKVLGVFKWGLEEKTVTANAALTGLGRTRRIILGDTMLTGYSKDEIIAVLAHEVGHYKNRDVFRLMTVGAILATVGFYVAHLCLRVLIVKFKFSSLDDIGAFPIFVFCLFLFSLITMPLGNYYSRRREFAADEYAVSSLGSSSALVSALNKLAAQNLAEKKPAAWIEFLLHSHPSIHRRIQSAERVAHNLN